jgi:RimJ/RimL family protein N-acetyltransferase
VTEIQTQRLVMERPRQEHFEGWATLSADDETMRSLAREGGLTREAAWRDFAMMVGHWQLRGFGMFAVIERETGELVGRVGPWFPEGWPHLEVGWTLDPRFRGRGYATEAARASVRYAFDELDADHVIHLIADDNDASAAVAERIGAHLEGRATILGEDVRQYRSDR